MVSEPFQKPRERKTMSNSICKHGTQGKHEILFKLIPAVNKEEYPFSLFLSLSLSRTLSHSLTHSLSLTAPLLPSLTPSLSLSLSLSLSVSITLFHSLTEPFWSSSNEKMTFRSFVFSKIRYRWSFLSLADPTASIQVRKMKEINRERERERENRSVWGREGEVGVYYKCV